jgi:uncharacterized membrane protein
VLKESTLIEVALSASEIAIEPGGRAQLTITVENRQDHDDHVFIEIEGIDVEWYALPVSSFNLAAGGRHTAQVLFKIGRSSESRADTYPFLVRVKSMESGLSGVAQATLVVKPYSALQVEINPKRAVSSYFNHSAIVDVTVSNLGNIEETLDLYGSDPDDAFTYEFEPERVTVKPGHTEVLPVHIEPRARSLVGTTRLYGYNVTARSVRDSFVSGTAHGQLESRPFLTVVTTAITVLVLLALGAAVAFRPRPVEIRSFTVSPMQVTAGEPVTVTWDVANARDGIYVEPENVRHDTERGTTKLTLNQTGVVSLIARSGGQETKSAPVTVIVLPRPAVPKPRIVDFTVRPARIHQGESVTLQWKVDGATRIVLNPLGFDRDPKLYTSQNDTPGATTTYVLSAMNAAGDVATKSATVQVVPATTSLAEIVSFKAKPDQILTGQSSTLAWNVTNASSVEVTNVVGGALKPKDSVKVSPTTTTTYTLTAKDNKGIAVTKDITVKVSEPAPPPENPDSSNPGGTTANPPPGTH